MTTPKKAAPRLGPNAGDGQPPWAMVSPDGTDLYFPTKPEDAQAFAREFGAQPVSTDLWPWPSILRADGTIKINGDDDDDAAPAADLGADLGGQIVNPVTAPAAPEQPAPVPSDPPAPIVAQAPVQRARGGSKAQRSDADLLAYCPSPAVCFPLGLPANCSHVTCVHGSSS